MTVFRKNIFILYIMDLKYYDLIKGEHGRTEDRYVLKPEYRYDSTFKNPTPINADISEWERVENTLKTPLKYGPYDIPASDYGYGEQIHDVFNKRYADRVGRQQELAAGTMNPVEFQHTKQNTENLAAFKRLEQLKRRNPTSIPDDIMEEGEAFDETKPIDYYVKLENELYTRGFKGGKSRKSKKSKQSKKLNKSKKSRKSRKSRKSKK